MNQQPIKVLLIEDNRGDARLIQEMLAEGPAGRFDLAQADRLTTGLTLLVERGADVILLDLSLPDSQGLDTVARTHARAPETPIVILTGLDDEALALQAVELGAQDYLVKGDVNGRTLSRTIRYAIERQRAEVKLRESEARFRGLLESAPDAVLIVNREGRITFANEQTEKAFGYRRDELLGCSIEMLVPDRFQERHAQRRSGYLVAPRARPMDSDLELRGRRKDGSEFDADIMLGPLGEGGELSVLCIVRDISERKRAEEEIHRLNEELEQRVAERTAELGAVNRELEAFSYSVAHDLRAPLRHIAGYVELLREAAAPALDEASQRYLTTISDSAWRMGNLIDDLLAFSQMGRAEMQQTMVNLGALAREAIGALQSETAGRQIAWNIDPLPQVYADRALLQQVLVNLLSNAVKFTRARAQAVIEIGCVGDRDGEIVVFVRDNGAGFDMQYADKLFGVFQRLHRQSDYEGTGIGLANVRRIIHRHGGRTWAEGAVDGGATFYISLPKRREVQP